MPIRCLAEAVELCIKGELTDKEFAEFRDTLLLKKRRELIDALQRTTGLRYVEALNDRALTALVRAQGELAYLDEREIGTEADERVIQDALRSLRHTGMLF